MGTIVEALRGLGFGEQPLSLALEREGEVATVLVGYEQKFARLARNADRQTQLPSWSVRTNDGDSRRYLIQRRGEQLQEARCEWPSSEQTTIVTFGPNTTIRAVKVTEPSAIVLAASGIVILEHVLPASPGLVCSGRVGEFTIRPVAKRGGNHVGTEVEMLIPFQLEGFLPLLNNHQLRQFIFSLTKQGVVKGRLFQEGRCLSEYAYPHFDMAQLAHAALREGFGEVLQESTAVI